MELIVHDGMQVLFSALELLPGSQNLLRHLVLPDIYTPGVNKGDDEKDRQHAVEQDLERVVMIGGGIGVQDLVVFLRGTDLTQRRQHTQPVTAGQDHERDKDNFKQQKQQSPQNLPPGYIAEAHHEEGKLGFPVSVNKGVHNVGDFGADSFSALLDEFPDLQE